jgi:squalene cyclase
MMSRKDTTHRINPSASIAFIETHGSELEKARLRCILYGLQPEPQVLQSFTGLQNEDGGFPFGLAPGNLSAVDNTLSALWWLDELKLLESATVDKGLEYLEAVQREDGGWDEAPSLAQYDLPPWVNPGDLRTRLYLSAYAAYWLAVRGYLPQPAFQKALHFLLEHQDESGKFYGYLHATWIATSVFRIVDKGYTQAAEKGLQYLASRDLSTWADSQITWALDCLGRAGLGKEHPFIEACLAELLRRQEPAGSWSSEDGETFAVGATIEALKVLKFYGCCKP